MAMHDREDSDAMEDEPPKKRCKVVPVPDLSIRKISAKHLPEMMECKHAMRCRRNGCSGKSRVRCMACNVYDVCKVTEIVLLDSMHTMNKISELYILQFCLLYVNIKPLSTYVHIRHPTKYFRSKFFFVF